MKIKIIIILVSTVASLSFAAGPRYSDWSEPVNLGPLINTAFNDQHAAISKDGLSLYFTSNRPGGLGADDLWVSTRESTLDAWSTPVNAGPSLNTVHFDGAPALSSDNETIFFYSNRPGGFGANDLYVSTRHKLSGGTNEPEQ
jgi:WD40-like Beta Propeller Repeat